MVKLETLRDLVSIQSSLECSKIFDYIISKVNPYAKQVARLQNKKNNKEALIRYSQIRKL